MKWKNNVHSTIVYHIFPTIIELVGSVSACKINGHCISQATSTSNLVSFQPVLSGYLLKTATLGCPEVDCYGLAVHVYNIMSYLLKYYYVS